MGANRSPLFLSCCLSTCFIAFLRGGSESTSTTGPNKTLWDPESLENADAD